MPPRSGRITLLTLLLVLAGLSCLCALVLPFSGPPHLPGRISTVHKIPLPHHVAKYPGGIALRLAMVHDTIHERYAVHGKAFYAKRNQLAQEALTKEKNKQGPWQPTREYFALLDDLAVGLEKLGQHAEAVDVMQKKLEEQKKHGFSGRDLYGTHANLGTFLVLWQIEEGFADLPKAKARMKESIAHIRKAIEVNPEAHFGREIWQVVLEEFILAALDDPELLHRYDMVGNLLEVEVDPQFRSCAQQHFRYTVFPALPGDDATPDQRSNYRGMITTVGAEDELWSQRVPTAHNKPVPFDEPTLGIVGMWRMGGGANPFFALGLGEIMMRVGQRPIAWTAYQRAIGLAQGFSADPEQVKKFVAHCRKRQAVIEKQLPPEEAQDLAGRFEKELAHGQKYQRAYQDFEAQQIAAGAGIHDPHFYDAFHAQHGPIASRVGDEEYLIEHRRPAPWPELILVVGALAFAAAVYYRVRQRTIRTIGTT